MRRLLLGPLGRVVRYRFGFSGGLFRGLLGSFGFLCKLKKVSRDNLIYGSDWDLDSSYISRVLFGKFR